MSTWVYTAQALLPQSSARVIAVHEFHLVLLSSLLWCGNLIHTWLLYISLEQVYSVQYRDNLAMFLHNNIFCDPPLELSCQDSPNKGSQHMFSLRNKKNYLWIILIPPLIWSSVYFLSYQCIMVFEYCKFFIQMDDLQFYAPFSSISVISGYWEGDNAKNPF